MILLVECLIGIILFTIIVVPMSVKDPIGVISDYPPAIRERCILNSREIISRTVSQYPCIRIVYVVSQ